MIVPVYHVTRFLDAALHSAIAQDYPDTEILVVDDGSEPAAGRRIGRICARYPQVRLLRCPHRGAAGARMAGVAETTAEAIVFLDADDMLQPGALTTLAHALQAAPHAVATYARFQETDSRGTARTPPKPAEDRLVSGPAVLRMLLQGKLMMLNGTVCIRRAAAAAILPRTLHLSQGEDWVLWCHLARDGDIVCAGPEVVLHYRKHARNISANVPRNPAPLFHALETVYQDPLFSAAIGTETLRTLRDAFIARLHAQLAADCARRGDAAGAAHYLRHGSVHMVRHHTTTGPL